MSKLLKDIVDGGGGMEMETPINRPWPNFNRLDETLNDPHGESGLLKPERIKPPGHLEQSGWGLLKTIQLTILKLSCSKSIRMKM